MNLYTVCPSPSRGHKFHISNSDIGHELIAFHNFPSRPHRQLNGTQIICDNHRHDDQSIYLSIIYGILSIQIELFFFTGKWSIHKKSERIKNKAILKVPLIKNEFFVTVLMSPWLALVLCVVKKEKVPFSVCRGRKKKKKKKKVARRLQSCQVK